MRAGDRFQVNSGENKGKIGIILEHIVVSNFKTFWSIRFENGMQSVIEESKLETILPK